MIKPRKSIKVLYLHASAELYGSDLILYQLVTHLDKTRYNPVVVLPFNGPLVDKLKSAGIEVFIKPLPVLRRSLYNRAGFVRFGSVFFTSLLFLTKFIKSNDIGIVHTNTSATWGGNVAAKICGVPHVCSAMEIVEEPLFVAKAMALMTTCFSDRILTVSTAVKEHFVRFVPFGHGKYQVLFPPVDIERFKFRKDSRNKIRKQLGIGDNSILIGMAGRLNHWKGQDVFIKACALVVNILKENDINKDVRFLVLGGPVPGREYFAEELHKSIEKLGLKNVVIAPGFKSNIEEWLSAMDIFVLPSKWPEPSSTGVVAAMAVGLPVIGTNIGGTPETVVDGETGLLVPPNDHVALADAIVKLISSDELRSRMSHQAAKRARTLYSIKSYVDSVMKCYDELLKGKSGTR